MPTGNGLPRDFFARLIWKESRFDPGRRQPGRRRRHRPVHAGHGHDARPRRHSFDIEQAIPASAHYLGELKTGFGNLGLAAAAYNAGENRVSRWLSSGGFLPLETEDYVLDIMGEPADNFADARLCRHGPAARPEAGFRRGLPQAAGDHESHDRRHGDRSTSSRGASRSPAISAAPPRSASGSALSGRFPALLADHEPVVSRVRTPLGRRGIYAVRIGADDRARRRHHLPAAARRRRRLHRGAEQVAANASATRRRPGQSDLVSSALGDERRRRSQHGRPLAIGLKQVVRLGDQAVELLARPVGAMQRRPASPCRRPRPCRSPCPSLRRRRSDRADRRRAGRRARSPSRIPPAARGRPRRAGDDRAGLAGEADQRAGLHRLQRDDAGLVGRGFARPRDRAPGRRPCRRCRRRAPAPAPASSRRSAGELRVAGASAMMSKASVSRLSPARMAVASSKALCTVGWPRRRSSSSMAGRSSWISE